MANVMTPAELRELLTTLLEGAAGETRAHWEQAIGPVEKLPLWEAMHCNWRVRPKVRGRDLRAIEQAVTLVREAHPYVAGPT